MLGHAVPDESHPTAMLSCNGIGRGGNLVGMGRMGARGWGDDHDVAEDETSGCGYSTCGTDES